MKNNFLNVQAAFLRKKITCIVIGKPEENRVLYLIGDVAWWAARCRPAESYVFVVLLDFWLNCILHVDHKLYHCNTLGKLLAEPGADIVLKF